MLKLSLSLSLKIPTMNDLNITKIYDSSFTFHCNSAYLFFERQSTLIFKNNIPHIECALGENSFEDGL